MAESPTLLLLLVGLPPSPPSLRVRFWRRLRSLGAVALKSSAYLLPDTPDRYEDFQWLAQLIQREGGEATLIRVQQIENLKAADVVRLFHEPRNADYKALATRYRKVLQSLDRKSAARRVHDDLARLAKDHQRIRAIDFFDAPGGAEVVRLERAKLRDRRLTTLAEIVHEADVLRDDKYSHEEARGIDAAIRALLAASPDDHQVLQHGMTLFEGLYATATGKKS